MPPIPMQQSETRAWAAWQKREHVQRAPFLHFFFFFSIRRVQKEVITLARALANPRHRQPSLPEHPIHLSGSSAAAMSKRVEYTRDESASSAPAAKRARSDRDAALLAELAAQGASTEKKEYVLHIYHVAMGEAGSDEESFVAAEAALKVAVSSAAAAMAAEVADDDAKKGDAPAAASAAAAAGAKPRRFACAESLCGAAFS